MTGEPIESGQVKFGCRSHSTTSWISMEALPNVMLPVLSVMNDADNAANTNIRGNFLCSCCLLSDSAIQIDKKNAWGGTPLFLACQENQIQMVTILIQKGADVNFCKLRHRKQMVEQHCLKRFQKVQIS